MTTGLIALGFVAALAMGAPEGDAPKPRVARRSTVVVKVSDRAKATDSLIAEAERLGGYFTSRSDDAVTLKVPVGRADALLAKVAPLGTVIAQTHEAQDLGATLLEQATLLRSKEEVYDRYLAVLNRASPETIVEVEATITQVVQEIETLRGAIRFIKHQLALAELTVRFEFHDRRPPERSGASSFAWLNTINLADLFVEFAHD